MMEKRKMERGVVELADTESLAAPIAQQIADMVDMLPETDQALAFELVKKLVLAWNLLGCNELTDRRIWGKTRPAQPEVAEVPAQFG